MLGEAVQVPSFVRACGNKVNRLGCSYSAGVVVNKAACAGV